MRAGFTNPEALLLLLLFIPIFIYYKQYIDKKKKVSMKFSSSHILKESLNKKTQRKLWFRQHLPFILSVLTIFFLIIAISDPYIPLKGVKKGVNVVLAIDDSGSMAATDYKPTRLEAAKRAAEILIRSLKPKDYIGIVVFADGATTASYLTPFKDRAIEKLRNIKQKQGRTAIGDGLASAIDMATSIPNKKRIVILLSDGVNNAGSISPDEAIQYAKDSKVQVYTVGLGSEGKVVLGYDWFGNPQYAELDETTLKKIAQETGGKYFKSVNDKTLDEIYKTISKDIKREWEDTSIKDWFIYLALITQLINVYLIYIKYPIIV